MEIEGQTSSCLSLVSNEDGTLRKDNVTETYDTASSSFDSNILHTVQPTVTMRIEMEGTGSSIVGITNGETIVPLYRIMFRHHSTVKFRLHLKENKQQVKATLNEETSTIRVDPEQGVKLDIKLLSGSFNIVLAQNGKIVMKLKTDGFESCLTDVGGETCLPGNANTAKTADDDKDDDMVDMKGTTAQFYRLSHFESQWSLQPISENTNLSARRTNNCADKKMNNLNEKDDAKESLIEQSEERLRPINNKESEVAGVDLLLTEENQTYKTRMVKIETVDIRTHRVELLTRMDARRLVNYFFQAKLISEEDMEEINESEGRRNANERLLKILRNRNVSKQNVSLVLSRAEEEHLIEYMFPTEMMVKTVSTQTECSLDKNQTRSGL